MNLLNYTKNLYNKINFYDKIIKSKNFPNNISNPFAKQCPSIFTVIWVEKNDKNF